MTVTEPRVAGPELERPRIARIRKLAPYFLAAVLLSIPCVWQRHIQAADLPSHLYNAWLANQAAAGLLKGLYVVPQYTNVVFDLMLSWLLQSGSVVLAERVAVLTAVQIFFWGCFALVSAAGGRPAWRAAPILVLLTYGAMFRMGFFNFYISLGICCAAIGLVWQNRPRARWLAVPLLLAATLAHYLPCLWALAVIGYLIVARRLKPSRRWWLLAAGLGGIGALAAFLALKIPSSWSPGPQVYSAFGADQAMIFSAKGGIIVGGLLGCFIWLLVRRFEMEPRPLEDIAFHLWILMGAASLAMPKALWTSFYAGGLIFITVRLSLLAAIMFCGAIARVPVKRTVKTALFVLLGLFLAFTYVDERALNSVEDKIDRAVAGLPSGARVIGALKDSRMVIQALQHIVDRPCIGHCFDFANYEPSTTQFRLRARPGNSYVILNGDDIFDIENETYVFTRTDVDVYRLSPCGAAHDICAVRLKPGERFSKQNIPALEPGFRRFR